MRRRDVETLLSVVDSETIEIDAREEFLINFLSSEKVAKSTRKIATKLFDRYKSKLSKYNMEGAIAAARNWVNYNSENTPAKQCINCIADIAYVFEDKKSKINMRQLLALAWIAVHDDNLRKVNLEEARYIFINALHEIQIAHDLLKKYNLIEIDQKISPENAFNGLMSKLAGMHQDIPKKSMRFHEIELTLAKTMRIKILDFLDDLFDEERLPGFLRAFSQLARHGTPIIWECIKFEIAGKMLAEFGYLDPNKSTHNETILHHSNQGRFIRFNAIPKLSHGITKSNGYRGYCSFLLYRAPKILAQSCEQPAIEEAENKQAIVRFV